MVLSIQVIFKLAQLAGAAEYSDCISAEGKTPLWVSLDMTIWWLDSSNAGVIGNAEYPFIAITPCSTLAGVGSIW